MSNPEQELKGGATQNADRRRKNWFAEGRGYCDKLFKSNFSWLLGNIFVRTMAFLFAAFFVAAALLWALDKLFYIYLARTYVDEVAQTFDLNKHLANALVIASFIAILFLSSFLWSFSKSRRWIGIVGIALLLVGHSLLLWVGTRNSFFDPTGRAEKCYVLSREGIVTYGERAGIDAVTGRLCRPITAEMLERLRQYQTGRRPQVILSEPTFFEPRSGVKEPHDPAPPVQTKFSAPGAEPLSEDRRLEPVAAS